jgi:hypothetical protein
MSNFSVNAVNTLNATNAEISSNFTLSGFLTDSNSSSGDAGQVLTSLGSGTGVAWLNQAAAVPCGIIDLNTGTWNFDSTGFKQSFTLPVTLYGNSIIQVTTINSDSLTAAACWIISVAPIDGDLQVTLASDPTQAPYSVETLNAAWSLPFAGNP